MPDFLNDLKDKALDVWRRAPTVVVVCGVGLQLLCSTCCLCGGCMGMFMGSGDSSGGDGASSSEATSGRAAEMTKEELIAKIDSLGNPCDRQEFLREIGEAGRTQTMDGKLAGVFWYYRCSDGTVQVVLLNPNYGIGEHNDKSKIYVSRINDF